MPPKIPRRCSKPQCREWQPCPKPGHAAGWASSKTNLPHNWKALKTMMAPLKVHGCARCGAKHRKLQLDHKIPRFAGGGNNIENLQWLDKDCHDEKSREDLLKYKGWTGREGKRKRPPGP